MRFLFPLLLAAPLASFAASDSAVAPSTPASDPVVTTASIQDTNEAGGDGPRGTRFFVVLAVDGTAVSIDAKSASIRASIGMGPSMNARHVDRDVPVGVRRLKLSGSLGFAAPIQSIFAALTSGGSREVSGEVDADLKPGVHYVVTGVIDDLRSAVWLEDWDSQQLVPGTRIDVPTAEGLKAAAAPLAYACCNLHLDSDRWISDANWLTKPFLPAGTPIRVYEMKSDRAKAMIDDKLTWLGLDYARKQQSMTQLAANLAVAEDPTPRIRSYPPEVQSAIRVGKVMPGMTKEQVIVSLGYPRRDLTPSMAAPRWSYMDESDVKYALLWDADDRLQAVEAPPALQALLVCAAECAASH